MMEATATTRVRPRLGFVGVGWIGLNRMRDLVRDDCAEAAVLADPNPDALSNAFDVAPAAKTCDDLEAVLRSEVDGIVLATPSGMHAEQAIRALEAGKHVFCQKPLGRTARETADVVETARRNDRLLGVDFCYRYTRGMQVARDAIRSGKIGDVYAADLTFHNAYGPEKSWAMDPSLSGGGCIIDLGIHLIDLLLWTLEGADVTEASGVLYRDGVRLRLPTRKVENYGMATVGLSNGATARLACSWRFSPGRDAAIQAAFYGTDGSIMFENVDGSFYDFRVEHRRGSDRELLVEPPDEWGSRAAAAWAERLAENGRFDPQINSAVEVAEVIDMIYGGRSGDA